MKMSSFVVLALLSHGACFSAEGFSFKDIPKSSDEKQHTGFVDLGEPSPIPFMYESTSKGNGVLTLKNLKLRVYDEHQDLITFEGNYLKLEWLSAENGKVNGLVVSGIANIYEEDGEKVVRREPIACFFRWVKETKKFDVIYGRGIELITP
jgi:hypothetical protein